MQDSSANARNRRQSIVLPNENPEAAQAPAPRRRRLAPEEREALILDEAISFFAERGFNGQLRDLAKQAGISQSLIFRYFTTKQALVEKVYHRVYVARWSSLWEKDLRDTSRPLQGRLEKFYTSYMEAIGGHEWIRVALFSGLDGNDLTRRYIDTRVDGLMRLIADEIRRDIPATQKLDPALLHELVWHLHSTFIYYLVRRHVFRVPTLADVDTLIAQAVANFLAGLGSVAVTRRGRVAKATGKR